MGTTLQHGIFLPAEGERNCYTGLASNWTILDGVIGGYSAHAADLTIHVTAADKEAWNGKADSSALTAHTGDTTIHVTAADKEAWNGKADASALTAHTGDTTIHVTAEDKQAWNGKQDALSQTQLDAVNSGIDSSKVQQIATNTSDISSLQSGKANDSDVVHKSGNETISDAKTFSENLTIYNSDINSTPKRLQIKNQLWVMGAIDSRTPTSSVAFLDKNDQQTAGVVASKGTAGQTYLRFLVRTLDNNNSSVTEELYFYINKSGEVVLRPWHDNTVNMGYSGYKWKDVCTYLVNGLNPSSLGLPSSSYVDISAYITNLSGGSNQYVAPDNGIVAVDISNTTRYVLYNNDLGIGDRLTGSNFRRAAIIQVRKNDSVIIQSDGGTLNYAKFYPCQGNI